MSLESRKSRLDRLSYEFRQKKLAIKSFYDFYEQCHVGEGVMYSGTRYILSYACSETTQLILTSIILIQEESGINRIEFDLIQQGDRKKLKQLKVI